MLAGCASLVEKSLLQGRLTPHGEPRFAMLETIREYGLECLMVAGEAQAVRWRHAQCMLALAEEVRPKLHGPEQEEWLERLEQEHDNLRAALAWAAARNEDRDHP
jgi:predicted ATPase